VGKNVEILPWLHPCNQLFELQRLNHSFSVEKLYLTLLILNLLASYRFYDCAIRHMTEPDHLEESDEWHFGLFLHQQYLQQQADKVMEELVNIKRLVH
jgi:hypothetical protein